MLYPVTAALIEGLGTVELLQFDGRQRFEILPNKGSVASGLPSSCVVPGLPEGQAYPV